MKRLHDEMLFTICKALNLGVRKFFHFYANVCLKKVIFFCFMTHVANICFLTVYSSFASKVVSSFFGAEIIVLLFSILPQLPALHDHFVKLTKNEEAL